MFEQPSDVLIVPLPSLPEEQAQELLRGELFQAWPEVDSRWMQRVLEEEGAFDENGFYVFQPKCYKFKLEISGPLRVVSVIGEYLLTSVTWN